MTTLIPKFEQTSSTTNRAFNLKLNEYLSVGDFGATGNGTTDDTTAIQAAIAQAISSGKNVYFPAGTYLWTASAYTIQPLTNKGLILFGEGKSSQINVAANNIIFNVISSDTSRFICDSLYFNVPDTTTNNNVTMFYVANGTTFGAYFGFENCVISGAATCVQGIRASGSYAKNTNFYGLGTTVGANVRLWGADGTTTTQDHSFSNICRFEQCNFNNSQVGIQGYGIANSTVENCVFQGLNIGIINVSNSDGVGGITSSTTRCGYGIANIDINNGWFEVIGVANVTNEDVDLTTGVPIVGTVYAGVSGVNFLGSRYSDLLFIPANLAYGTFNPITAQYFQSNAVSRTAAAFTSETIDLNFGNPGGNIQNVMGALITVSGYTESGLANGNALWQVGGFINDSANTRITQIINSCDSGMTIALAYQSAGVVRLTLTNGTAKQQVYKVAYSLNKDWI